MLINNISATLFPEDVVNTINHYTAEILHAANTSIAPTELQISPVDWNNKTTIKVTDSTSKLLTIIKVLNGLRMDGTESFALYDLAVNEYASKISSRVIPRQSQIFLSATAEYSALICYKPLGTALTYETNPTELITAARYIAQTLKELHLNTISDRHGKKIQKDPSKVSTKDICWKTTHYLFADLKRENIPRASEIISIIEEKWFPIFSKTKVYALTHRDVMLNNTIKTSDGKYTLIDWSYSIWQDPCHDIANLIFWLLLFNLNYEASGIFQNLQKDYLFKGFDLSETFPYFLARRFFDQGRYTNDQYIEVGFELLKTNNFLDALQVSVNGLNKININIQNQKELWR